MLQGLKSKKRHLILLSDVLNISNKSLTMALGLSLYTLAEEEKNCVARIQYSKQWLWSLFSKKPFSSLGFYYTHVLIKVIHSRRIKELLSLFFAHFLSFCSHFVSVARLFFAFRKGFGFSTTPYTPPSSIQKSLKLTLAWPENDNKDIIICLLVCKISLK